MAADNHTTIVGNLVENPQVRFTHTGTAVANLRVAVTQQIQQDGQMRRSAPNGPEWWAFGAGCIAVIRTEPTPGPGSGVAGGAVGVTHVTAGHLHFADRARAEGVPHGRIWASCGNGDMMKRVPGEASWLAALLWTDLMQCGHWRGGQRRETEGVDEFAASCCLKVLDIQARRAEAGR